MSIEVAGKWDEFGAPPRFAQVTIWPSCKAGRVSIKSYLDYLQFCFTDSTLENCKLQRSMGWTAMVFCSSCPFGANVGHCIDSTNIYKPPACVHMPSLALRHGFKLVYFPSREGPNGEPPVNISAWWLPAASRPGDSSPRIVALHGLASNNNHCGF